MSSSEKSDSDSESGKSPLRLASSIESSRDAGSEGVVRSEGEKGRGCRSGEGDSSASLMPRLLTVERLGVDLDWKPLGSEEPLLCGGIVSCSCNEVGR